MASSPTRGRARTRRLCASGKVTFLSYADALDAAERLMELGIVEPGCHMTPYECEDCGRWHVFNRRIVWLR